MCWLSPHQIAVDELVPDRRDQAGHGRQREVARSHPVEGEVGISGAGVIEGGFDLDDLGLGERVPPVG